MPWLCERLGVLRRLASQTLPRPPQAAPTTSAVCFTLSMRAIPSMCSYRRLGASKRSRAHGKYLREIGSRLNLGQPQRSTQVLKHLTRQLHVLRVDAHSAAPLRGSLHSSQAGESRTRASSPHQGLSSTAREGCTSALQNMRASACIHSGLPSRNEKKALSISVPDPG